MSYRATVVNIMIASPSDVAKERQLVRDVIADWNAVNSSHQETILMPVGWESHSTPEMGDRPQGIINTQLLRECDLLVAVFWTRLGSPTGVAESGTVEEIEEHLKSGKPAMLYFSSQPVRPDSVDSEQYTALKKFKEACRKKGLVEDYESLTEFRDKFSRQLGQAVIRRFPNTSAEAQDIPTLQSEPAIGISEQAEQLLWEASKDNSGVIMKLSTLGGTRVQTNGREFNEQQDARSEALWRGAVDELHYLDLIEDRAGKGEVFFMTDKGFRIADRLAITC